MTTYPVEQLSRWDKEYVWHPFTQMQEYRREEPLIIERGEGSFLIDVRGNRYLDGISSLWVNVHGHNHPRLNLALKNQLDHIAHSTLLGLANVPSIKLAKKLVAITPPGLNKVFYSDAGATAVEIAIKIAFQYWQQYEGGRYKTKTKFVSLGEAYHGDTIGSVSVGGMDLFHAMYKPLLFHGYQIPAPFCYRCSFGQTAGSCRQECLTVAEQVISTHTAKIAALIIEPLVQGAAGMIVQPPGYLRRLREICTRHNVLLICDEVAVGFGRTGTLFASEQEGVHPDLMCVAKGLTGGYLPLAATLTTDKVFDAFLGDHAEAKTFFHGHTYTGNPLGCAVALESIRLMEEGDLINSTREKAAVLARELERFNELEHVGEIRRQGMMIGIELVKNRTTKEPYPREMNIGHQVVLHARRNGLIIRPLDNVIVLMPILAMSLEELKQVVDITYASIKAVTE
ncbi:MAG: adenosylmethionine--8-amino-7-oxononanoate transaminase [Heliobacteriaceae bacterium]|nr:adenosylmethionine--8-amino-7-oxononanoate transaminase [Heliobacteriaceae bacterium]